MSLFFLCLTAVLGGWVFQVCQLPLSWLLGPMFGTILYVRLAKHSPKLPFSFRDIGLLVIGYLIGKQFTKQTLLEMGSHLPSMLLMTVIRIAWSCMYHFEINTQ